MYVGVCGCGTIQYICVLLCSVCVCACGYDTQGFFFFLYLVVCAELLQSGVCFRSQAPLCFSVNHGVATLLRMSHRQFNPDEKPPCSWRAACPNAALRRDFHVCPEFGARGCCSTAYWRACRLTVAQCCDCCPSQSGKMKRSQSVPHSGMRPAAWVCRRCTLAVAASRDESSPARPLSTTS